LTWVLPQRLGLSPDSISAMTALFDTARDYAQSHTTSIATGLFIALPGTYLLISGTSISCAVGLCSNLATKSHSALVRPTEGLSLHQIIYSLDQRLSLPTSRWDDRPAPRIIMQVIQGIQKNIVTFLIATGDRFGCDFHHILVNLDNRWADRFPLSRFGLVVAATALPLTFLISIRKCPGSWVAKHSNQVVNTLHVLALVTVANQRISIQDLLAIAFVMASFEAFQRSLISVGAECEEDTSAPETLLAQTHSIMAQSDIKVLLPDTLDSSMQDQSPALSRSNILTCKEEEVLRLQRSLTEAKTSEKVKEIEMKRAQADLRTARDTLNETFAEYSSLRDEMKTMKQTVGRDHQTIIYRKDIELFALRKGNEQKENLIKDKDTKLEEVHRVHKATLELKDAQMQNLKERVAFLEKKDNKCTIEGEVKSVSRAKGDQAVQVKLLRVKGRNSLDVERSVEQKEAKISKLKGDLASAAKASEILAMKQDELRRAWDATYELQNALTEEQQMHMQTRDKLQEVFIQLDEQVKRQGERGSPARLPTIEEQDKKELETMFNSAQQDNLRLYAELDALDKRLREANARVFVSDREIDQLREQLRLEKGINEDMETARPSLVHRVHFQRMEGQLKDSQDLISDKEDEIVLLKEDIAAKDQDIVDILKAKADVLSDCSALKIEREELKMTIQSLETTKQQLMLDHERLAAHRSRQRTQSSDHASTRSSGATLTDPNANLQVVTNDAAEEPLPTAEPVTTIEMSEIRDGPDGGSIQNTPASTYRFPLSTRDKRISMISDKAPPKELRGTHSKRQSLKGFMLKVVGKDSEGEKKDKMSVTGTGKETTKRKEESLLKAKRQSGLAPKPKISALAPRDKNTLMRPTTARISGLKVDTGAGDGKMTVKEAPRPKTAGPFVTSGAKATTPEASTPTRYYAAHEIQPKDEKIDTGVNTSSPRPKSSGWVTS
jgi:hypothetical protein